MTLSPRTRRNDGCKLVTDEPMSLREIAMWCSLSVTLASYAVAVMMGWLPNPIGWVL